MRNDILKIKIIRDFNKIKKSIKSTTLYKNNITYPQKYIKLLDLIRNTWLIQYSSKIPYLSPENITISDLNSIDLNLFENIINLYNTKIVDSPLVKIFYIENNEIKTLTKCVGDFNGDVIYHIKHNEKYIFYIYQISNTYCRWYRHEDKDYLKNLRKQKLEKLNM